MTAIGEGGPKVLARLQDITNGQLSLVQSAELANIALSSGFSTEQIEGLTQVGVKASRARKRFNRFGPKTFTWCVKTRT